MGKRREGEDLHEGKLMSCSLAAHSSILAWRIPGTEKPGGLLSMGSHRVGHDWIDLAAAAAKICGRTTGFTSLGIFLQWLWEHLLLFPIAEREKWMAQALLVNVFVLHACIICPETLQPIGCSQIISCGSYSSGPFIFSSHLQAFGGRRLKGGMGNHITSRERSRMFLPLCIKNQFTRF